MKYPRSLCIQLCLLLLACSAWAQMGESNTKVRLISPTQTIVPGKTWKVGLELRHAPHWHTYWINPGEAGLITEVNWQPMPAGFSVGPTLWPPPAKIDVGGVLGYGYDGTVVLILPVHVPPDAKPGDTVKLEGTATWLECYESCVPGEAPVSISATVGRAEEPTADAALIQKFEAMIPQPLSAQKDVWLKIVSVKTPKQKGDPFEVKLELSGKGIDAAQAGQADFFPYASDVVALAGGAKAAAVGEGVTVTLAGTLAQDVASGSAELAGVLKYYRPGETTPSYGVVSLDVMAAGKSAAAPPAGGSSGPAPPAYSLRGLLSAMFFALIGGLILNIMPCVLPVISLKVFSFVKQARESRGRLFYLGVVYCLGVLVSFWLLAGAMIAIKSAGGDANWGGLFQYPVFVILMTGVIFALALNMFGVYEISAPSGKAVQGLAELESREGPLGAFSTGVLATVLATPCSAPFLGTAIAFALPQPAPVILAIFSAVGAGLALPFLFLSAFPGWTRFIPKPGLWMVRFKQVMGFLLMATAIWLLYVVGQLLGVEGLVWTLAFLTALGFSCWMIGSYITYTTSKARRTTVWALALLVAAAGYGYFVHLYLHPIERDNAIEWIAYSPEKLEELRAQKRLVFVDATAEWCLTCKANEKLVIDTDAVREKFNQLDVVALKADFTRKDAVIASLLQEFNRRGVPLYVIYPTNGKDPIALPEAITPGMVLEKLDEAS